MDTFRQIRCRAYQAALRRALPLMPYREPHILADTEDIAALCDVLGIRSIAIVAGKSVTALGLADHAIEYCKAASIHVAYYGETAPNPTMGNVEEVCRLYRDNDCQALVGFGGGSSIDCAKAAAARIARPDLDICKMAGVLKIHAKTPPIIAVPTTAGSGSEATVAAVISDQESNRKFPINDFCLVPAYAVHDYRLTLSLPAKTTAETGMDALTHAVEAYIGMSATAKTRAMAEEAVELIARFLKRAYENGSDSEARQAMLRASYCAGVAFTLSYVGYVHGLAHALGGRYNISHGFANAVILPHMLRAYGPHCHERLASLARLIGLGEGSDSHLAAAFIDWIEEMNASMGIPKYIDGIEECDIPALALHADSESNPLYPVPVLMDANELASMFRVVGHLS